MHLVLLLSLEAQHTDPHVQCSLSLWVQEEWGAGTLCLAVCK